jgi:RecJ-like exonuclease
MKMNSKNLILLICLVFMGNVLFAQYTNIGSAKCKMCHMGAAKGDQFKKWSESKHAKANTATGVAGKAECEKCHAPVAEFKAEGVTCEVCHGPGSAYKSAMKPLETAKSKGLIVPDEALCKKCHDASKAPSGHKAITFDYAAASKIISHKKP